MKVILMGHPTFMHYCGQAQKNNDLPMMGVHTDFFEPSVISGSAGVSPASQILKTTRARRPRSQGDPKWEMD
jgi:hypothetical protein